MSNKSFFATMPRTLTAGTVAERVAGAERRTAEAIAEAYRYRELWEAAASCLHHNRKKLERPRGEDERRLLDAVEKCGCGHYWSGRTDGWLPEAALVNYQIPKGACAECDALRLEVERLAQAIRETIMDNLHLADGEICTLITLKRAINFSLDDELGSAINDDGTTKP